MRLSFVYPPQEICKSAYAGNVRRQYQKEGAILPPLGIAYLASLLEKKHTVTIIDANVLGLKIHEVIAKLDLFKPDILMFSLTTPGFHNDLAWIRLIKKKHDCPVIVGGPQATLYPTETLTFQEIDFCVIGQGWETLPELIGCLNVGGDCQAVQGIAYRHNGIITLTEKRQGRININEAPFPARHLLPNQMYTTLLSKRRPVTVMMSSSGCPFHCIYCMHEKDVVFRDPLKVIDEMQECRARFKIREIDFYDDIFSLDKERAARMCEEMIRRKLDLVWSIRTRPDCVDEQLIKLFAKAGCIRIHYGVESGSPEILKVIKRDISLSQITKAVDWTRKEGIAALGFFVIGFPGETRDSILKTMKLTRKLEFDYIQISKLVPTPDTRVYAMLKEKSGRDIWREYILGQQEQPAGFAPLDSDISAEELDKWLIKAYRYFYLRPRYILRTLLKVRSFKELRGLVNSALSLR